MRIPVSGKRLNTQQVPGFYHNYSTIDCKTNHISITFGIFSLFLKIINKTYLVEYFIYFPSEETNAECQVYLFKFLGLKLFKNIVVINCGLIQTPVEVFTGIHKARQCMMHIMYHFTCQ